MRNLVGGEVPLEIGAWDGSRAGPADAPARMVLRTPLALRRLLYSPDEVGFGRAFVTGDLEVEGDLYAALEAVERLIHPTDGRGVRESRRARVAAVRAATRLGALGPPPPLPPEEARLGGRRGSLRRASAAISHHYDVSNEFYRVVLGPAMTYSCAYWADPSLDLVAAQEAKHDLICRKLALRPGMRLLDIGCGWGGMVMHAAARYGARAVGVTISPAQAALARERVREAGLADLVEIRLQDFREVRDGPYDAISSIGMAEHVGEERHHAAYSATLARLVAPEGRVLNHAIGRKAGPRSDPRRSFVARYVFPDGELHTLGTTVRYLEEARLEVRDVESLREHYALTLRAWVANLERRWDEAVAIVGLGRARVWRLYMSAAAVSFEAGHTNLNQVLAVRLGAHGESGMPMTRDWLLAAGDHAGEARSERAAAAE